MSNADDVPIETATINITMHGDTDIQLQSIALGLFNPQVLITMSMEKDSALMFDIETGGIPFDETDPRQAYSELAQVLRMLGDQLEAEVTKDDTL